MYLNMLLVAFREKRRARFWKSRCGILSRKPNSVFPLSPTNSTKENI